MTETSPRPKARLAGVFYLLTGGTAFAEVVRSSVVMHDDAAATAHNIVASEPLYRVAFAADICGIASYLIVTLLLYALLKPVSRSISLLAASIGLVGVATQTFASLWYLAPLLLLGGEHYLAAFGAAQLQAMTLLSLHLYTQAFNIALVFFGLYCASLGYLIFRSTFLPRILGVLMTLAGLGLLTNSFLAFLAPGVASALTPLTLGLDGIGELALMLWLLIVGVNVQKRQEQANRQMT